MLKRIRSVERALRRVDGQDAAAAEALRGKLCALQTSREGSRAAEREKRLARKYHMVKFVERQKLTRRIRALDREVADASSSELGALQKERADLETQLAYVMYYPRDLKYVGLFVGELDARSLGVVARAKEAAMRARREDLEAGRPDRVRSCLGREVALAEGGTELMGLAASLRGSGSTVDKREVFGGRRAVEQRAAEEDDFFGDASSVGDEQPRKKRAVAPTREGRERRGDGAQRTGARFAPGHKQSDRLNRWKEQRRGNSFIAESSPSSGMSSYGKQTYDRGANRGGDGPSKRPVLRAGGNASADRWRAAHGSLWAAGEGVSAAGATERNRQKQIGLIVQGAGTKRRFGDDE